jgi:hypothetical protein
MSSLKTTNILHPSSASNNIVLDSSGNIAVQAGTAGAPAIQANGDSNTGIYFPAADNIGFTTGGTIRGRWTTSGLCFNADTAAANALDDYEEGTWTPTFTGTGATFTYSSQQGNYIKIGTLVYAVFYVQISAISGGSGTCGIGGLPFTTGNSASNPNPGGYIQLVGNWNTNHPDSLEASGASTTQLNLLYRSAANGTNNQSVPTSNFQANTFVRATIVYFSS